MSFNERVALVTGGSRGIGRSICLELGRRGCHVAFNYSSSPALGDSLKGEIESLGRRAFAFQMNAADAAAAESMVRQVKEQFGRLDFLVNNAGITRDRLLLRMSEQDWDDVLNVNLKSAFLFSRAAVPLMLRARYGSILNITSVSGLVGMPGQSNYSASKAGMIGFTKALAKEVASRNVTVNALALGLVETDMTRSMPAEYREKMIAAIPLGRYSTPDEVAGIAAFLLSDEARYITGQVLQADGGLAI